MFLPNLKSSLLFESQLIHFSTPSLIIPSKMALRGAWWMQTPPTGPPTRSSSTTKPHLAWPWNQAVGGISFGILEKTLLEQPGRLCKVDQFAYRSSIPAHGQPLSTSTTRAQWLYQKTATTLDELVNLLTQPVSTRFPTL